MSTALSQDIKQCDQLSKRTVGGKQVDLQNDRTYTAIMGVPGILRHIAAKFVTATTFFQSTKYARNAKLAPTKNVADKGKKKKKGWGISFGKLPTV